MADSIEENAQQDAGEQQGDPETKFPPIAGGGMANEGPEISGNDMIGGHTGISGTGGLSGEAEAERHNPGGTPTI